MPKPSLASVRQVLSRLIGRRRGDDAQAFWESRVSRYGRRAAIDLRHAESEFEEVTAQQSRDLLPLLAGLLDGTERTVVDFGCGPGRFTASLAQLVSGRAIGVDVVPAFLQMAPRAPNVEYTIMRGADSGLPTGVADVVWVCLVLGGLKDRGLRQAVNEIIRLLRPGGLMFLVENTTDQQGPPHWTFRSLDEYRAMFPEIALQPRGDMNDLGQRNSILAGRSAKVGG
jgi:SAM-dependent methyltransferase